jgi:hypothetical protein
MGGMAMIAGTRTVLYFGRNGMGTLCYGNGTADQSLVGTMGPDGAHYCYDPTSSDKGQHAYPYRYQIWAYDMNDLAAVKNGTKQPWDVVPYGVWPFDFPTHDEQMKIGGVGYDAEKQLLYVSQMLVDKDGYAYRPLIHVLHVNATPGTVDPNDALPLPPSTSTTTATTTPVTQPAPTVTPVVTPQTTTTSVVSSITLSVNKTSPQVAGTVITFTAAAIGGTTPQEYKWLVNDGTGFKAVTSWTTSTTFTWTPTVANPKYRIRVWARSAGNTDDDAEAVASATFAITAPASAPASTLPLREVAISWDKAAPLPSGSTVTFTATTVGGSNLEYKWLIHDGLQWNIVTGWSSSNSFAWTAGGANASNRVGVWVRTAGNTQEGGEVTRSEDYPIAAAVATTSTTQVVTAPTTTTTATTTTTTAATSTSAASTTTTSQSSVTETASITVNGTRSAITVAPGAQLSVVLANSGATNTWDYVMVAPVGAAANYWTGVFQFMNGTTTLPPSAIRNATITVVAPTTPGTYELRFNAAGQFNRLATSGVITVAGVVPPAQAPAPAPSSSAGSVTVNGVAGSATVAAGAVMSVVVANTGTANTWDYVMVAPAGAATNYFSGIFQFLNGTTTLPSSAIRNATLAVVAPTAPGTYEVRFNAAGQFERLATTTIIVR